MNKASGKRRDNDKIKKDFCESNCIPLLEIPFWDYDKIENMIDDFIRKEGILDDSNRDNSR